MNTSFPSSPSWLKKYTLVLGNRRGMHTATSQRHGQVKEQLLRFHWHFPLIKVFYFCRTFQIAWRYHWTIHTMKIRQFTLTIHTTADEHTQVRNHLLWPSNQVRPSNSFPRRWIRTQDMNELTVWYLSYFSQELYFSRISSSYIIYSFVRTLWEMSSLLSMLISIAN